MWMEWLTAHPNADKLEFKPPATAQDIEGIASVIGRPLPDELVDLLRETDGIVGKWGVHLVCPAREIAQHNRGLRALPHYRELYMPFDSLLFFGEVGDGGLFGFPLLEGDGAEHPNVFVWDHENDSRTWAASNLRDYINRVLTGLIKL
jgi:hypothetical protein